MSLSFLKKLLGGNNVKNWHKLLKQVSLVAVVFILLLGFAAGDLSATKKKKQDKKRNGEVDAAAAAKKYNFELVKSWSFGWENYKNRQYDRAKKHFWKLVEIDTIKRFPKVYRYLGDCYFKSNDPDSAQVVFEMGVKKYPEDPHLHRMVGFLKAQREQIDEAILSYEKVVELEPKKKDDWKQLASLYVRADRIQDAISAYDTVLQLDPNDLEAQTNQSTLITSTGDVQGAIESKLKIAEQDSLNSQVRFELGNLYFNEGEYEQAIKWFQEFLVLSPNDLGALEKIGMSYERLEKVRDAIKTFKQILEADPQNKKAMCDISRSYKELGRFVRARTYANKALAVDRTYGLAWIALGEIYEAAADKCVKKKEEKVDFNDKLVYEIAAAKYRRALKDMAYRQNAERHLSYLQGILPTSEDKFMHKNQKKPTGECYDWIN